MYLVGKLHCGIFDHADVTVAVTTLVLETLIKNLIGKILWYSVIDLQLWGYKQVSSTLCNTTL